LEKEPKNQKTPRLGRDATSVQENKVKQV